MLSTLYIGQMLKVQYKYSVYTERNNEMHSYIDETREKREMDRSSRKS